MNKPDDLSQYEVGYDIPAKAGMAEAEIQTPALILDLDALERNITKMGDYARAHGLRHRVHGKMHKSVDVAHLQQRLGGADGVCCQKVAEAEVFARGGVRDILVSNEVRDPIKIDRLGQLPKFGAVVSVCVDDLANVADLSAAATRHGVTLDALVEVECGAERCGVTSTEDAVALARAIDAAPGLTFGGFQAYQGAAQHIEDYDARAKRLDHVIAIARDVTEALTAAGLPPRIVTGAGTGSFTFEATSGVYNEIQCGSYAFMDADYGRIQGADGARLDQGMWENALFVLTSVMSHPTPDRAVVDAGLKALAVDSGLPVIYGLDNVEYLNCSDEHGVVADPSAALSINQRVRLVPGHCDPTCNLHDWYVGVRGGVVETLWPVSARGKGF